MNLIPNRFLLFSAILLTAILSLTAGCSPPQPGGTSSEPGTFNDAYPIRIVVTVGMIADLVRTIGGNRVQVEQLMDSGVDPHSYRPTRDDSVSIMKSDMVFYNGLLLEGKMGEALQAAAERRPTIAVAEGIDSAKRLKSDDGSEHPDPHAWMDVSLWIEATEVVATSLSSFDPAHAEEYRQRADGLKEQLSGLHEYGINSIASIPESSRILVTSHDAFRYFGRAYGVRVEGIQGISTESEAGLQRINQLVDELVGKKIPAVFCESSVSQKSLEAVVAGAGSRGQKVTVGGPLFSDAMGVTGTYEGTYIGMLDHNITQITRGLGGTAPERGWQGKLAR